MLSHISNTHWMGYNIATIFGGDSLGTRVIPKPDSLQSSAFKAFLSTIQPSNPAPNNGLLALPSALPDARPKARHMRLLPRHSGSQQPNTPKTNLLTPNRTFRYSFL